MKIVLFVTTTPFAANPSNREEVPPLFVSEKSSSVPVKYPEKQGSLSGAVFGVGAQV